jgi:ABC-type transporter MlaC component
MNTLRRSLLTFSLCLAAAGAGAPGARAGVPEAKEFMGDLVEVAQLSQSAGGKTNADSQAKIRALSARVDFEALGRRSLGARWKKISAAERADFLKTLQELLEVVVYPAAKKITVKSQDLGYREAPGGKVMVTGKVERDKNGERVVQDLEIGLIYDAKSKKIIDAVLEGEVFSANLNRQFTEALKKQSFASIIAKMKKRVADARATS